MWINSKTVKAPGFYENAHLHICLICLRHYVSSLTGIQYLQIEPSVKGTPCQWKYDASNNLSVRISQMNKVRLMGYRKQLFARL